MPSHIKPYSYRCPRCATLTCSLPCVKRHKKWAQCNGVRNPAAYIRISDLATPAGIDHDYNYLTSIEREFDKAEDAVESRGVILKKDERKPGQVFYKGEVNLKAGLERACVLVTKAPKGMSRAKTNLTAWSKTLKRLIWTVEWCFADGSKELGQCREDTSIQSHYEALARSKASRPAKRKGGYTNRGTKKKSRQTEQQQSTSCQAGSADENASPRVEENFDNVSIKQEQTESTSVARDVTHFDESSLASQSSAPLSFYLHTPSLPSAKKVVAPLVPEDTLSSCLKDRLVLEYPTIYIFDLVIGHPLPEGFMTEEEYFKTSRKALVAELEEGEIEEKKPMKDEEPTLDQIDEKRLMEVLGKDLGRA